MAALTHTWPEALDRCERRDPLGHAIHLGIGVLFMAVMPIGTAPSNIMSVALLIITIVRWRSVAPLLPLLLRWWPAPFALALAGWLALSLLWSADADRGVFLLASMRVLLLPVALVPLLARRGWLAGALLAGILLQALMQCGQYAMHRGAWNFDGLERFGGFTKDPGKAGLWDAIGVCAGVAIAITLARRHSWIGVGIALITMFATVASGTRRQIVALGVAIPMLLAWVLLVSPARRARVVTVLIVALIAIVAAWPFFGPSIMTRLRQTTQQISDAPVGHSAAPTGSDGAPLGDGAAPPSITAPPIRGIVHYDLRGYYWQAALEGFRAHPLRGLGLGGAASAIAGSSLRSPMEPWLRHELAVAYPEQTLEQREQELHSRLNSSHPHSTWLALLAEGGIIGFVLGLGAWTLAWITTLRRAMTDLTQRVHDPISLACAAALLLWAIGAIFDASINSTSLGAVVVLAVLGGLARPRHAQSGSLGQVGR